MSQKQSTDLDTLLEQKQMIEKSGKLHWIHWTVVLASLVLTFGAWSIAKTQQNEQIRAQFDREVDQTVQLITERMKTYEDALVGAAAFMQSREGLDDIKTWRVYSQALDIESKYPGVNGIGIIHNIRQDQKDAYLHFMRLDRPWFEIHPAHDEKELFPIAFIEPIENNAAAVGLDIAHEENRFTAAKLARDTLAPQITGPITLVQDSAHTPGFLLFFPFKKSITSPTDADQTIDYVSFSYAPFIFSNLMEGTLGAESRYVGLTISDTGSVLFDENEPNIPDFDPDPVFETSQDLDMYGRVWTINFRSTKSFHNANKSNKPLIILLGGITIDSLLLAVFLMLARSNRRAIAFASNLANIHESNAIQLSSIIENSVTGLIQLDLSGKVTAFNTASSELFDYTEEEAIGQNIRFIVPYLKPWKNEYDGKFFEHTGKRKDGTEFPIEISMRILDIQGQKLFSGIVRDISEQKKADSAIKKTLEELQLSNADLEKFAYIASHDLKSPLRAIDNLSAWIVEDAADQLDDTNKDRLGKLRGRVARMERLLDDLLQYSRAANKSYPAEPISAGDVVRDITQTLHVPESIEINIVNELDTMEVSRMPIEQVFHNLISNAIKHHDRGEGHITISGREKDGMHEFTVADDGPGIRPEYHDRIFEMFQTLKRRDEMEASGIGLAVVKKIVHRYGGMVSIDSAVGDGTRFIFTWPIFKDGAQDPA